MLSVHRPSLHSPPWTLSSWTPTPTSGPRSPAGARLSDPPRATPADWIAIALGQPKFPLARAPIPRADCWAPPGSGLGGK
ncbi:hypothetical protein E2562_017189 [Oryza meyeriana var. granulata]|uniref:Uncharacterized protein n=1 Tax=Oryza meyeriana var. granulata TaxID=110450 RepID=A0A6G1EKL9_9ORYZ|nr:hypothetical protein E2562_017189 [Oryza meyeriana var. granulata]